MNCLPDIYENVPDVYENEEEFFLAAPPSSEYPRCAIKPGSPRDVYCDALPYRYAAALDGSCSHLARAEEYSPINWSLPPQRHHDNGVSAGAGFVVSSAGNEEQGRHLDWNVPPLQIAMGHWSHHLQDPLINNGISKMDQLFSSHHHEGDIDVCLPASKHHSSTVLMVVVAPSPTTSPATMIEVAPGVHLPLRGADETLRAIEDDFYVPATCSCCTATIFCIQNANFVLCPDCRVVSRADVDDDACCCREANHPDDRNGGNSVTTTATNNSKSSKSVGLGFTMEELVQYQTEVVTRRAAALNS